MQNKFFFKTIFNIGRFTIIIASLHLSAVCVEASATTTETIVIQPGPSEGKDTMYGTAYHHYGNPNGTFLDTGGWGDWYHSYIEFDLSSLPASSSVLVNSELHLYQTITNSPNNGKIERITQTWTESGVTMFSNPLATSTGMSWQTIPMDDWWIVDITDLTKDWIDGTYNNYGVKISGQYNSGPVQKRFHSSDYTANSALRPKLVVEVVNYVPQANDLWVNSLVNPENLSNPSPEFSALYVDEDFGDKAVAYSLQVDNNSDFSSPLWDSGQTAMSTTTEGSRSPNITYGGSALASSTEYFWRIKFWDDGGAEGDWNITTFSFVAN